MQQFNYSAISQFINPLRLRAFARNSITVVAVTVSSSRRSVSISSITILQFHNSTIFQFQIVVNLYQCPYFVGMEMDYELKCFLDEKVLEFNGPDFIESDPIQVPKQFLDKEDIEIAAFLTASIAWGNRAAIIKNAQRLMALLDYQPLDFVLNASSVEMEGLQNFVHRTFNGSDCIYFIRSLRNIYKNHQGLQSVFETGFNKNRTVHAALAYFYHVFFEMKGERTRKHVSNVSKGASGKRLNMYLRWMVRKDKCGVDFGLWGGIPASELMLPLDVHTGNVGRKLGLLRRKSNDWKAVEEISASLKELDSEDPVKYDFALFGLGVFEKF